MPGQVGTTMDESAGGFKFIEPSPIYYGNHAGKAAIRNDRDNLKPNPYAIGGLDKSVYLVFL